MPAALLLDMDGTLVDSEPVHFRAHQRFLATQGIAVSEADLLGNIGKGDEVFFSDLARLAGIACDPAAWVVAKTALLHDLYRSEGLPLRPGVQELLAQAFASGVPCMVVTNSGRETARIALEAAGLDRRLPMRVCWEDTVAHKPDPAPYRLAASRLGLAPAMCQAIEDSPSGVRAAVAAGCRTLAVAGLVPAETLRRVGAHAVVSSLLGWEGL